MRKPEIDYIQKFCRETSLQRFIAHSSNQEITLIEKNAEQVMTGNIWRCAILWGNDDIRGVMIINFTTINILAMASSVFENTRDSVLFEHTKDFMKEYCNMYAGLLKGTLNNKNIITNISLPIISKSLTSHACLAGVPENSYKDNWNLVLGNSFIELSNTLVLSKNFDISSLLFLKDSEKESSSNDGDIEFF
ncbi:hypothetical protein A9Q84_06975 [Halobacteriovorax marinus]|uniref:Chemotaxis phosphatase CheX-like domain-containing protein n=1 Tax=Halobacteriovorax marinus TaxID=97084 RepID=A0A1Y5FFE7_9BACT|nr:hypothetical protein A9Q84_06975 [Halobacteriovorax marinus]